jgi:hypothetical protein
MSQVKNLRAMFENKGETSPPDRGRSPGLASSTYLIVQLHWKLEASGAFILLTDILKLALNLPDPCPKSGQVSLLSRKTAGLDCNETTATIPSFRRDAQV